MKKVRLSATPRNDLSKSVTKEARKQGQVPAVLYGLHQETIHCFLPMEKLLPLLDTIEPCFIELMLEGKEYTCIINESQFHPVSDIPLHIDLFSITNERPIRLEIPVIFKGKKESPGLLKGGELAIKKRTVTVKSLPKEMPQELTVDVSSLELGQKITVNSIEKGPYTILSQSQIPLAIVMIPRALRSKEAQKE
ncbi:MAG: 50S ribosomal protein L25 [Bacteroidota bacterium]